MVAALLEVHHDIEKGDWLGASLVKLFKVSGQNPAIEFPVSMRGRRGEEKEEEERVEGRKGKEREGMKEGGEEKKEGEEEERRGRKQGRKREEGGEEREEGGEKEGEGGRGRGKEREEGGEKRGKGRERKRKVREERGEGGEGIRIYSFFQKRRILSDSLLHRAQLNTHDQLSL